MINPHLYILSFPFCAGGRKKYKDQRHHERQLYNRACGFLVSDLGELAFLCYFKTLASILGIEGASLPGGMFGEEVPL